MLSGSIHLCSPSLTSLAIASHVFVGTNLAILFFKFDWNLGKQQQWWPLIFSTNSVSSGNDIPCVV